MTAAVAPTAPLLSTQGLGIAFGGLVAVNEVAVEVAPNAITSVIGPNGAGKSTLFNLISGALRPNAGHVIFEGRDVTGWSTTRLARAGLARSFQITNLFFDLSVRENLRLACQVLEPGIRQLLPVHRSTRANRKVEELLARFELEGKAGELAGYLSHGEQRRLEIALALACEPRLLLLDEPTQGMGHAETAETAELVKSLSADMAVLLIEHDIDLVMDLSSWVVVMHLGQKLSEGPPDAVKADPAVRKAYLGEA